MGKYGCVVLLIEMENCGRVLNTAIYWKAKETGLESPPELTPMVTYSFSQILSSKDSIVFLVVPVPGNQTI